MTEINEIISPARGHSNPSSNCPFCPPKARKGYTTYPGKANDSTILETCMETPSCLPQEQSGSRPQTGAEEDGQDIEQEKAKPRIKDDKKAYTFQAHHLISGNQAMKGEPIEMWIKASSKNKKATGYSINNTNNGFWAPSTPKKYVGKWGPNKQVLDDSQRQKLAEQVMKDFKAQIHIGPHNISDPDDPKGYKHTRYDVYIKDKLKELNDRVLAWSTKCRCESNPNKLPKQATHPLHNNLDRLSTHMKSQITGSPGKWKIFLSKYALDYHKTLCSHRVHRI